MNLKTWLYWLYDRAKNYNLFMLDVDDYQDDEDEEREDPAILLKHQKYTTRLYIVFLMMSLYVLFYITLIRSNPRTMTISNITPVRFHQLYLKHSDSLSCSCSTITIPYKNFVFNKISFHTVCSSIFVTKQWIEALYLINASDYGVTDFRSTARAQFQLLSDFCSICKKKISENEIEFNNNEFLTIDLREKTQIESEINATVKVLKESISTGIVSFLNYLRIYIRANYFVSALNTNLMLSTFPTKNQYFIYQLQTQYTENTTHGPTNTETMLCGTANPIIPVGFFSKVNGTGVFIHSAWSKLTENTPSVKGFFAGCTPLEGILSSTLDCLYDMECIQLLISYFPALNQLDLNWNDLILSSKQQQQQQQNITIYDHILNLFVEEWSTEMNYSKYFSECAPSSCSYTTTDPVNWSYAITVFISLYGGLIIILRLISPLLVKILLKFRNYSGRTTVNCASGNAYLSKFIKSIKRMNLFKNPDERSENQIKQQKIITRVYFILLFGLITVLLIFISLTTTMNTTTISNPSLSTYKKLQVLYSDSLRCPCCNRIISYQSLISISPTLHQICSSDFVTDRWLSIVANIYDHTPQDWRNRANQQFTLLSRLCHLANNTINDAIRQFLLQSLAVSNLLSEFEFNTQLHATLEQFFQSTINSFVSLIDIVHIFTQVDQLYMGSVVSLWTTNQDANLIANISTDNITNMQSLQVMFQKPGILHANLSSINCICATNAYCQSPVAIYQVDYVWNSRKRSDIVYTVPGSIAGCSNFDSLLFSQLLCFYSDSDCFSILMNYMKYSYYYNLEDPIWFDARPLVYINSTLSRYPPNTSISVIIKEIMIEKWNSSYSYENFYYLCAPDYCTYSEKVRTNTILNVIIILSSIFGGLTVSLRLIAYWLVSVVYKLLEMNVERRRRRQQQQQQGLAPGNRFSQFKMIMKNLISSFYDTIINLNIFPMRDLGSNIDRTRAKNIGKWSTRLYFTLFIIGLGILTLYTIIQPETLTKTFDKPSFNFYNKLKSKYKDKLKCSCSVISSKYEQFVQMNAHFHQICTSPFISDQWRINLTSSLTSNLSIYEQRDYRRFLSAHLEYLQQLCKHSIQTVEDSIKQFHNSLFITSELLSENDFYLRLNSSTEKKKKSIRKKFTDLFFLIRSINHGNAFVSMYGTNFQYSSTWFSNGEYYPYIYSEAIIYDNQCSCGLQANCTTEANFFLKNSSKILIKGLKIGCTPSESLHVSTLECFYDQSCLNLIQQYTYSINSTIIIPLSITMSQFLINTTVSELIDHLFVEQWIISFNYSSYYKQCLPSLCSYTYTQKFNILYITTLLLGLQGGLTIVLGWISPKIVRILMKIYGKRKRCVNVIQPECQTNISTDNIVSNNNTIPTNRSTIKFVLICLFILSIILSLILFSIYVARLTTSDTVLITSSTTMRITIMNNTTTKSTTITTTTTTTTPSTTHTPTCQLKFQLTTRYRSGSNAGLKSPVVADFNNDNLLDVVFFNYATNSSHVLIGDGEGNYTAELKTLVGSFTTWAFVIAAADFNHDENHDIIFTSEDRNYVYLLFGNGNGTFRSLTTIFMGNATRTRGIGIFDFNNDTNLDVALASQSENTIFVLLGYGNGSFSAKTSYYAGPNTNPSSLALADINGDGYQDIIYNNIMTRTVGVLLGKGDGTFQSQLTSFVGGYYNPSFIAIGHFNDDHRADITVSYSGGYRIGVVLGYGNGTMSAVAKLPLGNRTYYARIATGDFNNDGYSDIVAGSISPYDIYILVSYGDGNFDIQKIFSAGFNGLYSWMNVADFNNDGCQDILASDDTEGAIFILLNTCACQKNQIINTSTSLYL